MTGSPVKTHVACPLCASTDAAILFADGGTYCYSCKGGSAGEGQARPQESKPATVTGLIEYEVQALSKRGIGEGTAELWKCGYGTHRGEKCQVFAYRDGKGRTVAMKLKFAGKKFEIVGDAKKMSLYGQWLWRDKGRMVVVTEGELDALAVSQIQNDKWPVVSIPNGVSSAAKAVSAASEWLEGFDKVVLLFDDDEVGRAAALEAAAVLSPGKAYIATIPGYKDADEALMAGDSRKVVDAIWSAKVWRPDEIVDADAVWSRLLAMDHTHGLPIPHSGLDHALMGLRPAEITLIVAGTGAGKSTACREWAASLALAGHRIGYMGLEEGPERTLMGLLSVAVSRPLHLEEPPKLDAPDVVAAFRTLRENVVFYDAFGSVNPDLLTAKMRFLSVGEKCPVIFLDHLSIATSGGELAADERRSIDRLMTQLTSLVQATKVHVVAVCHLSRHKGVAHEEGGQISLADLRGSHGLSQLTYNVVAIERNQQGDEGERDVSMVRVLKCRHTGRTGEKGKLVYDEKTGRQTEHGVHFTDTTGDNL